MSKICCTAIAFRESHSVVYRVQKLFCNDPETQWKILLTYEPTDGLAELGTRDALSKKVPDVSILREIA